jgi:hypothetical protein
LNQFSHPEDGGIAFLRKIITNKTAWWKNEMMTTTGPYIITDI